MLVRAKELIMRRGGGGKGSSQNGQILGSVFLHAIAMISICLCYDLKKKTVCMENGINNTI